MFLIYSVALESETMSEKDRKEKEAVDKYLECVMKASQKLNAENPNHNIQTPIISKTKKKTLLLAKKKRVDNKSAPPINPMSSNETWVCHCIILILNLIS
jgi:hypothetical protein